MKILLITMLIIMSGMSLAKDSRLTYVKIKESNIKDWDHIKKKRLFKNWYSLTQSELNLAVGIFALSDTIIGYESFSKRGSKKLPELGDLFEDSLVSDFLAEGDPMQDRFYPAKGAESFGVGSEKALREFPYEADEKIIVAVVDTGVDYNHPDLKNIMWTNKEEIPGNGIDDDQNGYIDDFYGINTLIRDGEGKATSEPMDGHYHGTHVAGIIAAEHNNGKGIAGISSQVEIMAIRTVPNSSDELDIDVVEAFIYAAKHGAKVINCSFGKSISEGGEIVPEAIDYIYKEYGAIVVAAAGNDSGWMSKHDNDEDPKYPASWSNESLITVAASTSRGKMASYSNIGLNSVDIAAPGSGVYSTVRQGRYSSLSGTSMAAPVVSGILADLMARYPNLDGLFLKKHIMETGKSNKNMKGRIKYGAIADLYEAVRALEVN